MSPELNKAIEALISKIGEKELLDILVQVDSHFYGHTSKKVIAKMVERLSIVDESEIDGG